MMRTVHVLNLLLHLRSKQSGFYKYKINLSYTFCQEANKKIKVVWNCLFDIYSYQIAQQKKTVNPFVYKKLRNFYIAYCILHFAYSRKQSALSVNSICKNCVIILFYYSIFDWKDRNCSIVNRTLISRTNNS